MYDNFHINMTFEIFCFKYKSIHSSQLWSVLWRRVLLVLVFGVGDNPWVNAFLVQKCYVRCGSSKSVKCCDGCIFVRHYTNGVMGSIRLSGNVVYECNWRIHFHWWNVTKIKQIIDASLPSVLALLSYSMQRQQAIFDQVHTHFQTHLNYYLCQSQRLKSIIWFFVELHGELLISKRNLMKI